MKHMRRAIEMIGLSVFLFSGVALADNAPKLVVSIKPLHSLVAQVTQGVTKPTLLVGGTTSPHEFQMKPSDRRELEQADMVIYLDADYERFLARALASLPPSVHTMSVIDAANLTLLPIRSAGGFEAHDHHDHDHHHDDRENDYHVWLDPVRAQQMVKTIASTLSGRYPDYQQVFEANADNAIQSLIQLDQALKQTLNPIRGASFLLFHDATQYFESRYGLVAAGSVTLEPNEPVSWHRMQQLRKTIKKTNVSCVFTEPYFSDKQLRPSLSNAPLPIQRGVIDPEGTALQPGVALYSTLLHQMASAFVRCLSAG